MSLFKSKHGSSVLPDNIQKTFSAQNIRSKAEGDKHIMYQLFDIIEDYLTDKCTDVNDLLIRMMTLNDASTAMVAPIILDARRISRNRDKQMYSQTLFAVSTMVRNAAMEALLKVPLIFTKDLATAREAVLDTVRDKMEETQKLSEKMGGDKAGRDQFLTRWDKEFNESGIYEDKVKYNGPDAKCGDTLQRTFRRATRNRK